MTTDTNHTQSGEPCPVPGRRTADPCQGSTAQDPPDHCRRCSAGTRPGPEIGPVESTSRQRWFVLVAVGQLLRPMYTRRWRKRTPVALLAELLKRSVHAERRPPYKKMPGHLPAWRQCIPQASTRTADRCVGPQNHDQVVTDSFPVTLACPLTLLRQAT